MVHGIDTEQMRFVGNNQQPGAFRILKRRPADIFFVPAFSGIGVVFIELIANSSAVTSHQRIFSINIRFMRTASQPGDSVKTGIQNHLHTQPRQFLLLRIARHKIIFDPNIAVIENSKPTEPADIGFFHGKLLLHNHTFR